MQANNRGGHHGAPSNMIHCVWVRILNAADDRFGQVFSTWIGPNFDPNPSGFQGIHSENEKH